MKTDCCCQPEINAKACGCCEGVEALTPLPTSNRPGLTALSYRIGTHATFLETMKARLSSSAYPKLAELTTRAADDPSIAMLDAWATVADVLTFYQERIANEGYLRSATERRSVLELARLVGYQLRPGVSSSVYLAYTLDDNFKKEETIIPKGARSQSIPGPGELPQSFETSEDLKARAKWSKLKPRMTQPQIIPHSANGSKHNGDVTTIDRIYLEGISTNLKVNDPILFVEPSEFSKSPPRRVESIETNFAENRTLVKLQKGQTAQSIATIKRSAQATKPIWPPAIVVKHPKLALAGWIWKTVELFTEQSDAAWQLLGAFQPELLSMAYAALANEPVSNSPESIQALRVKATPFGATAPRKPIQDKNGRVIGDDEWLLDGINRVMVNSTLLNPSIA